MSNILKGGEIVVLQHRTSKTVITGVVKDDFVNRLGATALLDLVTVRGFDVENGTFNTNLWEIVGDRSFRHDGENYALIKIIEKLLKHEQA